VIYFTYSKNHSRVRELEAGGGGSAPAAR